MSDNQFDFGPAAKQIESLKGAANGLASLDSNGLVPSSQLPGATQSVAGLMSAADKTKLDGIATGATANVVSDSLSDTSTTNALSAAKGKALNDSVTALNNQIANDVFLKTAKNRVFSGNLNNLDLIGYYFGNAANITNAPVSSGYLAIIAFGFVQIALEYSSTGVKRTFIREYENTSWYPWKILSGSNDKTGSLNAGATYTFTLGQYACAKIWFYGYAADEIGLYVVRNNNGSVIIEEINSASKMYISSSGSNVSIKNNASYTIAYEIEGVVSAGVYGDITYT